MVFCGPLPITFHLIGSMRQTKEQILSYLGEHFADTLVECVEYVHQQQITADDVAKLPYMIHRIKDPAQRKALMEKADRYLQSISK